MLLGVLPGSPSNADGRTAFEQGVEAARSGDYRQAVAAFRAALEAGVDTPALHFNLGVALYRLGRTDEAVEPFRRAAQSEAMGGPAAYNLARIARERGDQQAARRWFEQAIEQAQTPAVRERARAQLEPNEPSQVSGAVGIGLGYDSNIDLTPADTGVSRESDEFALAEAYVEASRDETYVFGAMYAERYQSASEYDLTALQAGGGWDAADPWPSHRITLRHTRFGGEPFEDAVHWDAGAQYENAGGTVGIELGLAGFDGAAGFGYLDGYRWLAGTNWEQDALGGTWSVGYQLQIVRREDVSGAGHFYSYSYRRHEVTSHYGTTLAPGRTLALSATWAHYQYADPEVRRNGETLKRRQEQDLQVSATLEQTLTPDWLASADLAVQHRNANLEGYAYEGTGLTVRLVNQF